jgi:hypothetical protein
MTHMGLSEAPDPSRSSRSNPTGHERLTRFGKLTGVRSGAYCTGVMPWALPEPAHIPGQTEAYGTHGEHWLHSPVVRGHAARLRMCVYVHVCMYV